MSECVFVFMKLSSVCGVSNWSLMIVVLFVKTIEKSSAERVDEGGGGEVCESQNSCQFCCGIMSF